MALVGCSSTEVATPLDAGGGDGGLVDVIPGKSSLAVRLDSSFGRTCATADDGATWCWGNTTGFGTGDGITYANTETPVEIVTIPNAISLSVVSQHMCVVVADHSVWCWGENDFGQLGIVGFGSPLPVAVPGVAGALQVAAGGVMTCALLDDTSVTCWGDNTYGAVGAGEKVGILGPTAILTGVARLAAGTTHACAQMLDESVMCWGLNGLGQLGNGTTQGSRVPQVVPGLNGVAGVAAGEGITCTWHTDGMAACWGRNAYGAAGAAEETIFLTSPQLVQGLATVKKISVFSGQTCAVLDDGGARCWGQRQDGSFEVEQLPVPVQGLGAVKDISVGGSFACAIETSGRTVCWGHNVYNALGNPGPGSALPVPVQFGTQ